MHDSYEDVVIGETVSLGSVDISRADIVDFAEQYDPQPFHLGDVPESMFDGIVASGWHTAAVTMRLLVDGYISEATMLGSPGLDKLRWPTPVRPGDHLTASLTFTSKEEWSGERGVVHQEIETTNQNDETVLWMDALALYPRE